MVKSLDTVKNSSLLFWKKKPNKKPKTTIETKSSTKQKNSESRHLNLEELPISLAQT